MAVIEERAAGRCPRCDAPHDAYQEYCLECGLRLPSAYVATRETWWSRESPVWLVAALVAFLLIALAGVAAGMALDEYRGGQEAARTPARGAAAPATTVTTPTFPTATSPITRIEPTTPTTYTLPTITGTTGTTTTPTTGATGGSLTTWPAGRNGYTIVLASVPTSQGRSKADAAGRRALNAGLTQVGVLDSSDFTSLRPGYYVTFSGIYTTLNQAEGGLTTARGAGFPLAYVREIRGTAAGGTGSGLGSGGPGSGGPPSETGGDRLEGPAGVSG